jgi:hypothetical protein
MHRRCARRVSAQHSIVTREDPLRYYATPAAMTDLGRHLDAVHRVGPAIDAVVAVVQGLLIYDVVAQPFYGVAVPPGRGDEIHLRSARSILDRAVEIDPRPADAARPPDLRVLGRCRHFTLLTVAFLRAHGVPARARCGFATYFNRDTFEDHWVAEVWDHGAARWRLVDAQLDATWRERIGFAGDPLDVGDDQFIIAGRAWQSCRSGATPPSRYGLSFLGDYGLHWVAGDLRLDLAALSKVEMLPWDVWGLAWSSGNPAPDNLTPFDEIAALTVAPDHELDELRGRYRDDARFTMPGSVFNALRNREESVGAA